MSKRYDLIKYLLGEQPDKFYEKTLELARKRLVFSLVPAFNDNLKLYKKLRDCVAGRQNAPEEVDFSNTRKFIIDTLFFAGMIREIDDEQDRDLLRNYLAMYAMIYEKNKKLFDLIQELKMYMGLPTDKH